MVFRKKLAYHEIEFDLDKKCFGAELTPFSLPHRISEVRDRQNTLFSFLPKKIESDFRAKHITMKTVMTIDTNKKKFSKFKERFYFKQYAV